MNPEKSSVSRRTFLKTSAGFAASALVAARTAPTVIHAAPAVGPYQATGIRIGEILPTSVIVWTRLTATPTRNATGQDFEVNARVVKADQLPKPEGPVDQLRGACPGASGRVRLRYSTREDLSRATTTTWAEVNEAADFTHQFPLRDL